MQHVNSLPPSTRKLLERLSRRDDLEGFTLIGGTALALRHGHRMSEDIDLAWTGGGSMPMATVRTIVSELPQSAPATNLVDELQRDVFENEGTYLAGEHQDWLIDGVKLTFYSPMPRNAVVIEQDQPDRIGNLEYASDDALFKLKSLVLLDRTTSRDLFDLWWFHQHQRRTIGQIVANITEADKHNSMDTHLARIAPRQLRTDDPGFDTTLPGAPRTKEELLERMHALVDAHRHEVARRAALQAQMDRTGRGG